MEWPSGASEVSEEHKLWPAFYSVLMVGYKLPVTFRNEYDTECDHGTKQNIKGPYTPHKKQQRFLSNSLNENCCPYIKLLKNCCNCDKKCSVYGR